MARPPAGLRRRGRPTSAGAAHGHRLGRVVDWLDYAVELGASGVVLGPIFASHTHGYDTTDHFRIDPRLGDDADFDALIAAAHRRGACGCCSTGCSTTSGATSRPSRRPRRAAPEAAWFRRADGRRAGATFEGHDALVALNHDEPAVADYVVGVMSHWLTAGADGWRLDAAYAVPDRVLGAGPAPGAGAVPRCVLRGEVIHGDYADFVDGVGHGLRHPVRAVEGDLDTPSTTATSSSSTTPSAGTTPSWRRSCRMTFVGNHDVTRIASAIDDARHLPHALVALFTVAGTPACTTATSRRSAGSRRNARAATTPSGREFPATPADLSPLGDGIYRLHQELIGLRRRHPWLHRAGTTTLHLTNTALLYEVQADGKRLVTALNLDDTPLEHDVPGVSEVVAGAARLDGTAVTVAPHGWAVLS